MPLRPDKRFPHVTFVPELEYVLLRHGVEIGVYPTWDKAESASQRDSEEITRLYGAWGKEARYKIETRERSC